MPTNPSITQWCEQVPMASCNPVAVGAYWIEFDETCYRACLDNYVFESIETGAVRRDPTGTTTAADPNSPTLARRACAPLRIPRGWSLTFYGGGFGLLAGFTPNAYSGTYHSYLVRCGTRLRKLIAQEPYGYGAPPPPAVNSHAILWMRDDHHAEGFPLPSVRPVVIPLPRPISRVFYVALTNDRLYVSDNRQQVWSASAPAAPRGR